MSFLIMLGCIPEMSSNCSDISNTSGLYLGIIIGSIIGGIISWWIYDRQNKTSEKQDRLLLRIKLLEEHNEKILKDILKIEKKIDEILEKKFKDIK